MGKMDKKIIRFSVIMPLYNKAPYVEKAIRSVLEQTYPHYELIVINDGSTDNSAEIAEKLLEGVTNATFINQTNSGVAATRNNGVVIAKGEYICFLDADDWWKPTYLEQMAKLIRDYPDAGLYGMNYIYYKPDKTRVALKSKTGYINYPKEYLWNNAMMIFTSSSSMPKSVFEAVGGFPVGIKLGEDFLLWSKISLRYKVAFCETALAYYNNDVPATMRATRNLHKPEHHMLFMMSSLEEAIKNNNIENREDWNALLDWLRVNGLLEYWMSDEYHERAKQELIKVDWSKQSAKVCKMYKTPIWVLRAKQNFMRICSFVKQSLIRLIVRYS